MPRHSALESILRREEAILAPYAAKSRDATRLKPEAPQGFRTAFQLDRDRIVHTRAFRRLAHKTQVLTPSSGDHCRTRLTHTLEVSQIARTIARALRLNEDLAEAAAMGHDLGHGPFGHVGETVLNSLCKGGFSHQDQSLRVADTLADNGAGLNLTQEVRDAIAKHSKGQGPIFVGAPRGPATLEGMVVRVADIVAYLSHDMEDAMEAGILCVGDIPLEILEAFGESSETRKEAIVTDLLENTRERDGTLALAFSKGMERDMGKLRDFMYRAVYRNPKVDGQMEKGAKTIKAIYKAIMEDDGLYQGLPLRRLADNRSEAARDFIAGMTDRYALNFAKGLGEA
ncbi:MAG: deoxyguanosinetriphosphate triphosphohydrolase [Deltaproteobacteria bacterium]|jgi:dGTPase|nr:deoxyguanosinetriphosphate triphosphohydrolase [Deltaproteobacteria bacterium]